MLWWIALGVVLVGVVILVLVARPVLVRLAALDRAVRRARASQAQAATLQASVAQVQERLAAIQEQVPTPQPAGGAPNPGRRLTPSAEVVETSPAGGVNPAGRQGSIGSVSP